MPEYPKDAAWFTLQKRDKLTRRFRRVSPKWWAVDVDPLDVAETLGLGEYRAHYRGADKRINLGNGAPFWIEDAPPAAVAAAPELDCVDRISSGAPTATPTPAASPQPQRPPQPKPEPVAFAPPPVPPTATPDMSNFMFLWQMARQDSAQQMQLMMAQTQLMVSTSEARAQQAIQQSREFYAAMQAQQASSQVMLLEAGKNDGPSPELLEALGTQTQALATLGQRFDSLDQSDEQAEQLAQVVEQLNGEGAQGGNGSNAFAQMLQGMIPVGVRMFETYLAGQASAPADGAVVDTSIDEVVDSAAE